MSTYRNSAGGGVRKNKFTKQSRGRNESAQFTNQSRGRSQAQPRGKKALPSEPAEGERESQRRRIGDSLLSRWRSTGETGEGVAMIERRESYIAFMAWRADTPGTKRYKRKNADKDSYLKAAAQTNTPREPSTRAGKLSGKSGSTFTQPFQSKEKTWRSLSEKATKSTRQHGWMSTRTSTEGS